MSTAITFEEMVRLVEQEQLRGRIVSYGNIVRAQIPPWKEIDPPQPAHQRTDSDFSAVPRFN